MQAFIQNNSLIINSMIQENEKLDLLKFIEKTDYKTVKPVKLYDIEGNVSGIAFKLI